MKHLWVCLVFVLLNGPLRAQDPVYHRIGTDEGLPANEVYSMVQDAEGFLWIGCQAGLFRYNGHSFKQFVNREQTSSPTASLVWMPSGRLYCLNFSDQVFYWQNDSLHLLRTLKGAINLVPDTLGNIWITAAEGSFLYNETTDSWKHYSLPVPGEGLKYCRNPVPDESGGCWVIGSGSVEHITSTGHTALQVTTTEGVPYEVNNSMLFAFRGSPHLVHVPTGEQYFSLHGGRSVPLAWPGLQKVLTGRKVNHVQEMPDGRLWFSTFAGMVVYNADDDTAWVMHPQTAFSGVVFDREGNLWLSTLNDGLYRIPGLEYRSWGNDRTVMPGTHVSRVVVAGDSLYFSTMDGYVGIMDLKTERLSSYFSGEKSNILALCADRTGNRVIFNVSAQMKQLAGGRVSLVIDQIGAGKFLEFMDNRYFYGSSFGLYMFDEGINGPSYKLLTAWVRDILSADTDRYVWVAANTGIYRLNYKITGAPTDTLLAGKQILSLASDGRGNNYALSFNGAIYTWTGRNEPTPIAQLPDHVVAKEMLISGDRLLVATNHGLYHQELGSGFWWVFNKVSGARSNEITSLAVYKDQIWLGTSTGLQVLPADFVQALTTARVYLRSIHINGTPVAATRHYDFHHSDQVSLYTEAALYSSQGTHKYAYRVNNGSWYYLPANTDSILLANLPTGELQIELKVVDHQGLDSGNVIILNGTVRPPFWQQWWFYLLITVGGVGVAWMFFSRRILSLRRQQQQALEKIQLENQLELSQQTALKAQMNPHFIFNVLNSIKSFIYENDKKQATEYLNTFALLIRRILTMSGAPMVSLAEELETLELYIKLEAMLLEPPFDHSITVAGDVTPDDIEIPPLLIQPFVENAFKHGLRHKTGEKILNISLEMVAGKLVIAIEDNGIGRAGAAAVNRDREPQHRSFATEASSQRLNLLNRNRENAVNIAYIDRVDKQGQPAGTTVTLSIVIA